MAMISRKARSSQRGMSMIEMMIASVVLIVGVLGCAILIPLSIGSNFRNKQQSNSTAITQMVMEQILSIPANNSTVLTMNDCNGTAMSINTTGSTTGTGASVVNGEIDFGAAAPAGYSMLYTACGTGGRRATYDVRWNIQTPTNFVKLVIISAKLRATNAASDRRVFSLPVTIRSMSGQGS
jgi:Tfp pilus assembly protein PilV